MSILKMFSWNGKGTKKKSGLLFACCGSIHSCGTCYPCAVLSTVQPQSIQRRNQGHHCIAKCLVRCHFIIHLFRHNGRHFFFTKAQLKDKPRVPFASRHSEGPYFVCISFTGLWLQPISVYLWKQASFITFSREGMVHLFPPPKIIISYLQKLYLCMWSLHQNGSKCIQINFFSQTLFKKQIQYIFLLYCINCNIHMVISVLKQLH